jgi:LmbE family N-acetylglucosaminyl deacetylase
MPNNLKQCDIMAIGAHPDDIEFGCGGILAKMAAEGKKVLLVDLTSGEKGTNGTKEIRQLEGHEAAKTIGAERIFLDFKDCEIFDTYEGRLKLVEIIRTYRPSLVIAPLWKGEMNHPDHIATGLMARAAFRYARLAIPVCPYWQEGFILKMIQSSPEF